MNNLLLIASKVAKTADEIQHDDPTLSRVQAVQLAFKQLRNEI